MFMRILDSSISLSIFVSILAAGCSSLSPGGDDFSPSMGSAEEIRPKADEGEQAAPSRKSVKTLTIKPEALTSVVEVSGKAVAVRESTLSLGVPGLIKQITVKLGDRVKKGQVLLRLDRKGFELGVRQADAARAGASAAMDQLATEIARVRQLLSEGAAPSAALDDLLAKQKAADAQAQMASVSLEQAGKALRDSELRAPYDGVITEIYKEKGEYAPSMPPTMLMKIVDSSELDVQVFVPEEAASHVRVGAEAEVAVESANVVAKGKAVFVSDVISQGARTFEARIRIDNSDGRIKSGAFARVRLGEESIPDAILVPISALKRDEKDEPYAFVEQKGVARKRPLVLGRMEGSRVLVRSGLSAGERLIVSEISGIEDGRAIEIEN